MALLLLPRPHPRRRPAKKGFAEKPFQLTPPENADAFQAALSEILDAIASSRITPKRAGTLLYGLQLAQKSIECRPIDLAAPAHQPTPPLRDRDNLSRSR
jgi:hypothetical protein